MPNLTGDLAAVNMQATEGTLTARSMMLRPSGSVVITGEPKNAPIRGGKFSIELAAGPVAITIAGDGVSHDLVTTMPDADATLDQLVDDVVDWAPEVVNAARAAAREAAASARKAAASAAKVGNAQAVLEARSAAESAQAKAEASRDDSGEHAAEAKRQADLAGERQTAAETAATTAGEHQTAAETAVTDAEAQAKSAGEHENAAKTAQTAAEKAATNAHNYQELSWTGRTDALNAAKDANAAKAGAAEQAKAAETHAKAAASSCSDAKDAAANAAGEVREELSDLASQATSAAAGAKTSASEAKGSEAKARQYAEAAGEAVASGSPDATDTTKGKVRLAGDLSGTADAPTVPGLADKAEKTHTHALAEVDGAAAMKEKLDAATYSATADTLVRRGSDGTASFAVPTGSNHAATKGYVDGEIEVARTSLTAAVTMQTNAALNSAKKYADAKIQVVASEDEVGTEAGVLYLIPEES